MVPRKLTLNRVICGAQIALLLAVQQLPVSAQCVVGIPFCEAMRFDLSYGRPDEGCHDESDDCDHREVPLDSRVSHDRASRAMSYAGTVR